MDLDEYKKKRDFSTSPEPSGKPNSETGNANIFVVQQHRASRLHYDFRLELDGVFVSWAVPKGPSCNPNERSLAIRTEDHPLDYADFEGTIPEGHYGAGTVLVWDKGHWQPLEDPQDGLQKGKLSFTLHGTKLQGDWSLVEMKKGSKKQDEWLLIKKKDGDAVENGKDRLPDSHPESVLSGATLEELQKETASHTRTGYAISSPEKILFPDADITKADLADFYRDISSELLPGIKDRPLTLLRCPEGRNKNCFYQKHFKKGTDRRLREVSIEGEPYLFVADEGGILGLVQMGVLEIHVWNATVGSLETPDQIVFDLDPDPAVEWSQVVHVARRLKEVLETLDFQPFLRLSGGKGLHLVIPLTPQAGWDLIKDFSHRTAQLVEQLEPSLVTASSSKKQRKGKVYIDYLRNTKGASAIANFSLRAKPAAPIATPIRWDEASRVASANHYRYSNLKRRLSQLGDDPWSKFESSRIVVSKEDINSLAEL